MVQLGKYKLAFTKNCFRVPIITDDIHCVPKGTIKVVKLQDCYYSIHFRLFNSVAKNNIKQAEDVDLYCYLSDNFAISLDPDEQALCCNLSKSLLGADYAKLIKAVALNRDDVMVDIINKYRVEWDTREFLVPMQALNFNANDVNTIRIDYTTDCRPYCVKFYNSSSVNAVYTHYCQE